MLKLRPMLAETATLEDIQFPVYASLKLDGIRAMVVDGQLLSRTLKPIANDYTRYRFGLKELNGYDGELIVGPANSPTCFNTTTRAIARYDGRPEATFHVFDNYTAPVGFRQRQAFLAPREGVQVVLQHLVLTQEELCHIENSAINLGYEGLIIRSIDGPYKFGRSTLREGWMLKLKRFVDSEATIIAVEEEMENLNPKELDERGYTKRSSHQDNKVGKGRMGALVVVDNKTNVEFKIGTGFTAEQREELWLHGDVVKYKSFPVGEKDKPRHPVFLGRRIAWDTGEPT